MPSRTASLSLLRKCEYVASGQIGSCRKSMLTRETLQRPKLGEPLTRGRPKQPKNFTYGKPNKYDPNGIIECLTWPTDEETKISIDSECLPRDFHRINVESVKEGIHPVPDWLRFANEKDYRLNATKRVLGRLKKPKFPENMCFGKPYRPPTPMACVMSHAYKNLWDQQALEHNKDRMTQLARSQNDIPQPLDSTASILNIVPIEWNTLSKQEDSAPYKKLWKMPRFTGGNKRIKTYWSERQIRRR
ncbi:unnamed protein product [Trichobilharzia szidati]|nr:unnamed protein product [Trichobilharzia szidati]